MKISIITLEISVSGIHFLALVFKGEIYLLMGGGLNQHGLKNTSLHWSLLRADRKRREKWKTAISKCARCCHSVGWTITSNFERQFIACWVWILTLRIANDIPIFLMWLSVLPFINALLDSGLSGWHNSVTFCKGKQSFIMIYSFIHFQNTFHLMDMVLAPWMLIIHLDDTGYSCRKNIFAE